MFYTNVDQIGNKILHRWVDDNGKHRTEFVESDPVLFTPRQDGEYRGIRGEHLEKIEFDSIKSARAYIKSYDGVSNLAIHGNTNWAIQHIQATYGPDIEWDLSQIIIANIDIETRMGEGFPDPEIAPMEITAITVESNGVYAVFGSKEYTKTLPDHITHEYCPTEETLLIKFLLYWKHLEPNIVTGWNISGFDIPYLYNRINNTLGSPYTKMLAPTAARYTSKSVNIREYDGNKEYNLMGISIIDYLPLYKTFTYKTRERYSLDYIGYIELDERKLDYSEYGNLDDLYKADYNKYIDYNIRDVELVTRIDGKLNLIMLAITLAYMCHIKYSDVFHQLRMWDGLIYNKLLEDDIVVPPKGNYTKDEKYTGAVVFEPKVGMHNWVVSFDLKSLYPSLIMQYGISPELLVDVNSFNKRLLELETEIAVRGL